MPGPSRMSFGRRTRRMVAYGLGIGMAAPRTLAFAVEAALNGVDEPHRPRLSPSLVAQVAMDELLIAAMKMPGRFPRRAEYEAAGAELLQTHRVFVDRGWHDDPRSFHADPGAPDFVHVAPAWMGRDWWHVRFDSGFEPHFNGAVRSRWLAHEPNRTMHAWITTRHGDDAPWVVCVHPFGAGQSVLGQVIFRANALADTVGANVALAVLPMHGARATGRFVTGTAFLGHNPVDILLGLAQSVWDVRRLVAWLATIGSGPVALYGVSLGAHVSSLVAGLEPRLSGVVAGVPTADLLEVFQRHIPSRLRPRAIEHSLVGDEAKAMLRATCPLTFPSLVPKERLFIYAGTGDRMAPPEQAVALWEHWGRPEIRWFPTNHVAFLWSNEIASFVRGSLAAALGEPSRAA